MRSALPLLVFAALGACAHDGDQPMIVLGNTAQIPGSTICTYTGATGQPITAAGVVNALSPMGYLASPLIQSRVTSIMGQELYRTIEVEGAIVHLSVPAQTTGATVSLTSAETDFQALFSGDIAPLGSLNVQFELIPQSVLQAVASASGGSSIEIDVVAEVTVFGTLGGDTVKAEPWQFPVTVCTDTNGGCVVKDDGMCKGLTITTIRPGDPCNAFQDGNADCCEGSGGLVCPAVAM